MDYADRIKRLRDKMVISQKELAELLDVSFVTVNRWENGHYIPTIKIKRKLQDFFVKYDV